MTLIDRDGAPVAALLHDPSLDDEPELLAAVDGRGRDRSSRTRGCTSSFALASRNCVARARGWSSVANKERQRLERNLHDGAQQRLVALSLELSLLERRACGRYGCPGAADRARHRDRGVAGGAPRDRSRDPSGRRQRARARSRARAARRSRPGSSAAGGRRRMGGCQRRSRLRRTTSSAKASTNVGKYAQASSATVAVSTRERQCADRGDRRRRRRSRYGSAAADCVGSPTASKRSTADSGSGARAAAAPGSGRRSHARRDRGGQRPTPRRALRACSARADFDVVGCCETADDLMLKVRSYSPDVAIVDIRLPPTHQDEGLQAALEIRTKHPSVGVLVLSQYVEVGSGAQALRGDAPTAPGISSRTGSATSATSSARCVGSPRAARRSIRSSSRRSSPDAATTIRLAP